MLRMREKIRCRRCATFVLLRPAASGSLRSKACRGHAHNGKFGEARADFVALPGGAAAWRPGDAGRRYDAAGACAPARCVDGITAAVCEGRGLESERLV